MLGQRTGKYEYGTNGIKCDILIFKKKKKMVRLGNMSSPGTQTAKS